MRYTRGWIALIVLAILTPIGILVIGSAWGEWDLNSVTEIVGFAPDGMRNAQKKRPSAPFPEYEFPGLAAEGWRTGVGTILSALVGAGLTTAAALSIGRLVKHGTHS